MSTTPNDHDRGALIGAASIGFFLGAMFSAAVLASESKSTMSLLPGSGDGRIQWETLLTGLLALASAGWTVFAIQRQTSKTADIEVDKRARRERAARATLPIALMPFCTDAISCMNIFAILLDECVSQTLDKSLARQKLGDWKLPAMPDEAIAVIKECIEFAEDSPATAMTDLMLHFQIHHSNLANMLSQLSSAGSDQPVYQVYIVKIIISAAEAQARSSRLLEFARGVNQPSYQPSRDNLTNALGLAGIIDNELLTKEISTWKSKDYTPPKY